MSGEGAASVASAGAASTGVASAGEARRLYLGWYALMALGLAMGLLTPEPALEPVRNVKVLSAGELARFDGKQESRRFLAVLGEVFDVTEGAHYLPSNEYHYFVAKDGSAAFATGKFEGGWQDDVSELSDEHIVGISGWRDFYAKHESYKPVGVVVGRYYDEEGRRRPEAFAPIDAAIARDAAKRAAVKALEEQFPTCNSKWTQGEGSEIWCTDDMGGDAYTEKPPRLPEQRLVPRKMQGPAGERCACVSLDQATEDPHGYVPYPKCNLKAQRCKWSEEDLKG
jgi:hypothetical protein